MNHASPNLHEILLQELSKKRLRNASYSLRAFGKFLGISPGALSEILNGKRKISVKLGDKIAQRLALPPAESEGTDAYHRGTQHLSMEEFHVISDWYHYAIINLLDIRDFDPTPEAIAARLGISKKNAKDAWARLCRLKLIEQVGKNRWKVTDRLITSTHDLKSSALKKFHAQLLEKATESLISDEVEVRDMTSISMAIDPKHIPFAKQEITKFRRRLAQKLECGDQSRIYNLSIQLFPLDREGV